MPPPCGVESHVCCYKRLHQWISQDGTPLRGGVSRLVLLEAASVDFPRCHPLAGWSLTFGAQEAASVDFPRCHPLAGWSLTFVVTKGCISGFPKMPPPCGVESHVCCYSQSGYRPDKQESLRDLVGVFVCRVPCQVQSNNRL